MQHGNLAYRHFNPRSPHGERHDIARHAQEDTMPISTHAPRTGSD